MSHDNYNTYETYTINHQGRMIRVDFWIDYDMGAPWKEHDGHGPVRESKYPHRDQSDKQPGERPLNRAGRNERQWFYDWETAIKTAKKEGWCDCINVVMELTWKHKRFPTKGMIAEYAVEKDFEHLQGWVNDDWHWAGITVTDIETGVDHHIGGFESDDGEGMREYALDMCEEIYIDTVKAILAA